LTGVLALSSSILGLESTSIAVVVSLADNHQEPYQEIFGLLPFGRIEHL
jgi:hypothetical protein